MKTFAGHSEWVRQVKVSPDGKCASVSVRITAVLYPDLPFNLKCRLSPSQLFQ